MHPPRPVLGQPQSLATACNYLTISLSLPHGESNYQSASLHHLPQQSDPPSKTTFLYPPAIMNDESRLPSHFRRLFESALRDYERQTGMELVEHPLAKRLNDCHSVKSVVGVLRERVPAFGDGDRVVQSLEGIISVLHKLSNSAVLGKVAGIVRHKMSMSITTCP